MLVLSVGSVVNSCLWYRGSSAALPFSTILAMLSLWLCISLPLVYVGFFFGFRKRAYEMPVRTNQIPRAVPPPKFHQNLFVSTMLSGALPFGAVFIEVFFVYLAVWESRFYYFFGFLFAVFIILIICCSQVAIVLTYFQLCNEVSAFMEILVCCYIYIYTYIYVYT
ncbi:Transmembrane 9 superfamily member [Fasciolopsis buskii]|uniref:Transmembrane 9 superfamily member n=1 Tax=Fasciolopsis buskii TaxID=27845 RepID=A0A8E0RU11_9TREM|nr:Transmembrane 9 superfamily member [Fasciolopsis buski]